MKQKAKTTELNEYPALLLTFWQLTYLIVKADLNE